MAYIIFIQSAVLSGKMFGTDTGLEFGAITTATFISAERPQRSWVFTRGPDRAGAWNGKKSLLCFLIALFFSPLIAMIGAYPPVTAPALTIVGATMMQNVKKIEWEDYTESIPAFLIIVGIPSPYSIADGLALGFIRYAVVKGLSGALAKLAGLLTCSRSCSWRISSLCEAEWARVDSGFLRLWSERQRRCISRLNCSTLKRRNSQT